MNFWRSLQICGWSLGLALVCGLPVRAEPIAPVPTPSVFSLQEQRPTQIPLVLQTLTQADVVYLGETHDSDADHRAQLEIIQQLYRRNPKLAIGLEMFQRPYQSSLDQYLAGTITSAQLREQSQYDARWGYPWEYYEPILEFARAHRLPLFALNVPTEVTRKVAREGLEALSPDDRRWIPPQSEIRTDNTDYRQWLQQIFEEAHGGKGNSRSLDRFFLAQVLWDETMAEGISQFLKTRSGTQVVVLAGQGHVVYGYGIPDRVARRLRNHKGRSGKFRQITVLLNPSELLSKRGDRQPGDFFWVTSRQ